jgi:V/A-type H+/Na+-transporting ATPase subunit E
MELEQAILARAQQLADQFAEQAQRMRESLLRDAAERLRQREQREEALARALGDRRYQQRIQAAELKLQSNMDRIRWNLVRGVEARLDERMRSLIADEPAYLDYLRGLLREGLGQMEGTRLSVRTNAADGERLAAIWEAVCAETPERELRLDETPIETLGGVLLLSDDGRVRVDNTYEGRLARLRPRLQQVILERLLPASQEPGNPFTG